MLAIVLARFGIYRSFRERSLLALLGRILLTWSTWIGLIGCGLFLLSSSKVMPPQRLVCWSSLVLLWLLISHGLSRLLLRRLRVHGQNSRRDGFIGSIEGFEHLSQRISKDPWRGHQIWPALTWPRLQSPGADQLQTIGQLAAQDRVDQWIVEDTGQHEALTLVLAELAQQTCPVLLIPSWLRNHPVSPQPCQVAGLPALQLWSTEATPLKLRLKYLADKLFSSVLLVILFPLLLSISLVIVIDSPGPVLFGQRRYGEKGKPFRCLKFRTMRVLEDGDLVVQARRQDPRVTRIGAVLRRFNLDELPQLINVLRGEMSLVGPRPHAAAHNDYYRHRIAAYMRRHTLRPGLTGWAQVLGLRGETRTLDAMNQRVRADLDYIQNWSLLLDLEILLMTLWRWSGNNAF